MGEKGRHLDRTDLDQHTEIVRTHMICHFRPLQKNLSTGFVSCQGASKCFCKGDRILYRSQKVLINATNRLCSSHVTCQEKKMSLKDYELFIMPVR